MNDATKETVREMLRKIGEPNILQPRVEAENLRRRRAVLVRFYHEVFQKFPRFTMRELNNLTCGPYQIKQSRSYIQDEVI